MAQPRLPGGDLVGAHKGLCGRDHLAAGLAHQRLAHRADLHVALVADGADPDGRQRGASLHGARPGHPHPGGQQRLWQRHADADSDGGGLRRCHHRPSVAGGFQHRLRLLAQSGQCRLGLLGGKQHIAVCLCHGRKQALHSGVARYAAACRQCGSAALLA